MDHCVVSKFTEFVTANAASLAGAVIPEPARRSYAAVCCRHSCRIETLYTPTMLKLFSASLSALGFLITGHAFAQVPAPAPAVSAVAGAPSGTPIGYYRQPALAKDALVFVAEGDLWKVAPTGGVATRLTSHAADELRPAISPDGTQVAFTGQYEGPTEVYVMPLAGGLPTRLTFDGSRAVVVGWTPDGRIMATTDKFSTLPNQQLTLIDPKTRARTIVPLAQVSDGAFDPATPSAADATLIFTRLPFNGSSTKRYKGGTIQHLWKYRSGDKEATELLADFDGTSKHAMWWDGRVYFLSDRDGAMNVWSMAADGADLKQHTSHKGFDVADASLRDGKVAYQLGADLWMLDVASGKTAILPITLNTDLDQLRERWIEKPMDFLTSAHLSPDGEKIVMTARGRVFVAPAKQGRLVDVGRNDGVRYRAARFADDGKGEMSVLALSDETGEVEVWKLPANGVGKGEQLTKDAKVLRWETSPSPDGKRIAHHNKNQELWIYDVQKKTDTKIETSNIEDYNDLEWSQDSAWLAFGTYAENNFRIIRLWNASDGKITTLTTDRYDSYSPAWSADGKWLYFLSDRTLKTVQPSPWGSHQPDPYLDQKSKVYALALKRDQRWPFAAKDEVQQAKEKAEKEKEKDKEKKDADKPKDDAEKGDGEKKPTDKKDDAKKDGEKKKPKPVEIELDGIVSRVYETPIKPGNYSALAVNEKTLFWLSTPSGFDRKSDLESIEIKSEQPEVKTVLGDIASFEVSADGKKMLVRKKDTFYVVDAAPGPISDLDKKAVNLSGWSLSVIPRVQWRQMFIESWRLMRDYFYDTNMHGVDWRAMLDKYLPLVDRVTTRGELNDLIAQMVGELSALHTFVRGGDLRDGPDKIAVATLGAALARDEAAGGYRVQRIYQCESDDPERTSPLAKPDVACKPGDVISMIDGVATLSVPDVSMLLRQKAGKQVLIRVRPSKSDGAFDADRDAIVYPISQEVENDLRYTDWEHTRQLKVEELGAGKIGYLHLRAMGGGDYTNWVKGYYPVFNRDGLIVDVRHNRGGNIDSWILGKLMRKAWFAWSPRVGNPPSWNMQYAFRGHMVVLCNERTASDGEAFAEGFKRLGLGKVIGTRTWGGEIWLSSSNVLVDKGIASAAETGVYGPDGLWLIEGRGVEPDMVVDNGPHATFMGEDAQLVAAVEHLKKLIAEKPIPAVVPPQKPNKSFENAPAK